jgi:hypothetical protein
MQKQTVDAHSNTYFLDANFDGISYGYQFIDGLVVLGKSTGNHGFQPQKIDG